MKYAATMKNPAPQWLTVAVDLAGGKTLCEKEVFESPDGTWAVWVWKDEGDPILELPTRDLAERVASALHDAYRAGGTADYHYD